MKKSIPLSSVLGLGLLAMVSCQKNDPDMIYNAAESDNIVQQSLSGTEYSSQQLRQIVSTAPVGVLLGSGANTGEVTEARARYRITVGSSSYIMNVHLADFIDDPASLNEYITIASSSYSDNADQQALATQEMTNFTGDGALEIAHYPLSSLTPASSSLTDVVSNDVFAEDLSSLVYLGNTSGWIFANSSKNVVKVYLSSINRFGMVVEIDGSSSSDLTVQKAVEVLNHFDHWLNQK